MTQATELDTPSFKLAAIQHGNEKSLLDFIRTARRYQTSWPAIARWLHGEWGIDTNEQVVARWATKAGIK